jgi:hypothetical protein
MSISQEEKDLFLQNFQVKVMQGRKLLNSSNHKWADKLFTEIYFEIEKIEWLDAQKKRQFIMIISNSWWMYINSLTKKEADGTIKLDLIKYIDAYKRFFSFLSKLDDFYLFDNFCTNLLKTFITLEGLSREGFTKFINSFSQLLKNNELHLKLIEIQILLMFIRQSVTPSDLFQFAMESLGKLILKLEPGKRALFLYVLIENVDIKYQLTDNSQEFVKTVQVLLINRLSSYLKNVFSDLGKININSRNFSSILEELEDLIYYLNNIGESSWAIIIIRNLYSKFQEYQSFGDAIQYIRKFIDYSLTRNHFEIAFEIYDYMEDIFMYQTDLGYDNILIELWVQACKNFVDMKTKKFLIQSLEKLGNHLKFPTKSAQFYHFFYTYNHLWKFKGNFFSLEKRDFWRMMFYRALFEEQDYDLTQKILGQLDKSLSGRISDLKSLYNLGVSLRNEIYSLGTEYKVDDEIDPSFIILQMIIRINSEGRISYRMISSDNRVVDGQVLDETWNDRHMHDIYNDLFSGQEAKSYNFNVNDFGRLLYIFLPKRIRDLFRRFKIVSLDIVPQVYFIMDNMTIPFELIFDYNNFFLLKYSSAYKIGEPPLEGVPFDPIFQETLVMAPVKEVYNVLIIDAINSHSPLIWNEEIKNKELLFPFVDGMEELDFITNFFNSRDEVNQINLLSGPNSTKENVMLNLTQGAYHVIHFVGNIFYSRGSPKDSFFLTNDNNIITFEEIYNSLSQTQANIQPLLFFNTQIYDVDGKKLTNPLRAIGEIVAHFDYNRITGLVSKNYPIFDNESKEIVANFYISLFRNTSQGVALLKARQQCMAKRTSEGMDIGVITSLAISSYILFGRPWKKLSS